MTRKPPDPLANLFSRKHISLAQFKAGQEFRRCYRLADSQPAAEKMLTRCYLRLGDDGSALVDSRLDGQTGCGVAGHGERFRRQAIGGMPEFAFHGLWVCRRRRRRPRLEPGQHNEVMREPRPMYHRHGGLDLRGPVTCERACT